MEMVPESKVRVSLYETTDVAWQWLCFSTTTQMELLTEISENEKQNQHNNEVALKCGSEVW